MKRALRILAAGTVVILVIVGVRWLAARRARSDAPVIVRRVEAEARKERVSGTERRAPPSASSPVAPGAVVPDVTLIDHEGREFNISDLEGETIVLAFLYTHCNLPSMCPLTAGKFAEAREMVDQEKIPGVLFLLVSFDTDRDDPGTLKDFARRFGLDVPGVLMATGEAEEIRRLSTALKTFYRATVPGEFDHNIVVSVVDPNGMLSTELYGPEWRQDELLTALRDISAAS